MKRTILLTIAIAALSTLRAGIPDSVWVRPAALPRGGGLLLEWSSDGDRWQSVTEGRILGSDYGAWGSGKKLYSPSLTQRGDGLFVLAFQVDDRSEQFALCTTRDFIHWRPQDYPYMTGTGQCLDPQVRFEGEVCVVTFHNKQNVRFVTRSRNLAYFSKPVKASTDKVTTSRVRVPYTIVKALQDYQVAFGVKSERENELARDNEQRFAGVKDLRAEVIVDASRPKAISDKLMGIFFEDINYAADGGLNAQLIQNGDFEYDPHDRKGDENWNRLTAWQMVGEGATIVTDVSGDLTGISKNNAHAAGLFVEKVGASLQNQGWDGIAVEKGKKYDLSLCLMGGKVRVALMEGDKMLAQTTLSGGHDKWKRVKAVLSPSASATKAVLDIRPLQTGTMGLDMVSLIPQDTYKGHGLRRDLAETLAALHPRFMRFPGGCVTHGDGLGNIYNWKETIGPLENRKPLRNIWGYHQSRQIGFYEFFQMCEDMGMEPLPVLAAGVPCQNSSDGGNGQQGGIPMEDMPKYVQDVLDLIEWANGDASTVWGRKRIEQGHKKPFNLKYLGIGNEDLISPTFEERYLMICRAVKAKYPNIVICGTVGPFYYGSDYEEGWRIANRNADIIDMVDEHYYLPPSWYIYNQDFYDNYDRTAPKVYLGEWAAHVPGRKSTIETALCEALHYCSLERNGDVVEMSSYAPLLAKDGHTQWNPDMIYFNNTEVKPTVGYYAQMMCGQSAGNEYLPSSIRTDNRQRGVGERLAVSTVRNTQNGKTYLKLVNVLNHDVEAHLMLKYLLPGERICKRTLLTGAYDSTTAKPQSDEICLSPDCKYVMPAYSFTLIVID